jgi:galactoside O-acetyltransferase
MEPNPYYTREELMAFGFSSVGRYLQFSRKCSLYGVSGSLGDHVRVDDFCIFKGRIELGSHIHIAAFCSLSGVRGRILMRDFSSLGNRCSLYTGSDNYNSDSLSSSTVPEKYLDTLSGDVVLGQAAQIGAHSVVLPGTVIGDGASIGALCILNKPVPAGAILVSKSALPLQIGTRNVEKILGMADEVLRGDGGPDFAPSDSAHRAPSDRSELRRTSSANPAAQQADPI